MNLSNLLFNIGGDEFKKSVQSVRYIHQDVGLRIFERSYIFFTTVHDKRLD